MIKKSSKYILISAIILFIIGTCTNEVFAVTASPFSNTESYSDPGQFVKDIYNWGIGIVGLLAFFRLIHGGVLYMVSGAVDTKKKATGIITDAIVGLLLALSSYLIINIINPTLVGIKPISTETAGCITGEEVTSYLNSGYQCVGNSAISCSDHPGTAYFTCKLPNQ